MENDQDFILIDSDDEANDFAKKNPETDERTDEPDSLDLSDSSNWYSITVDDPAKHNKFDLLNRILKHVSPAEFVPVFSEKSNVLKKFYVTKCDAAIRNISMAGNMLYVENDYEIPFRLKVTHNDLPSKKINPFKIIYDAVQLRYTNHTCELNLSNFVDDFYLVDRVYFPLWYPGNQKVIHLLTKALSLSAVKSLNLSDNSLRSISDFKIPQCFPLVETLNLSRNCLPKLQMLKILNVNSFKIKILWLDGNDLCLDFVDEQNYIDCVKVIFPYIVKLDGKAFQVDGFPVTQRNYTKDWSATSLVNKFMEIYFTLFDSEERDLISEMYTSGAIFTISCLSQNTGASLFHKRSRNIKQKHTLKRRNVFTGTRSIVGCLGFLPKTEHDPQSFTVDVPYHTGAVTVVNITGVFKVPSSNLAQDEPLYEFLRSFVLVLVDNDYRYQIANDMLNISSTLTSKSANAFTLTATVKNRSYMTIIDPSTLSQSVMDGLVDLFINLTELPYSDALLLLEKNRWNFRAALLDAINLINKD